MIALAVDAVNDGINIRGVFNDEEDTDRQAVGWRYLEVSRAATSR